MTWDDLRTEVQTELQDGAGKLTLGDIDAALRATIRERYSKDRPQVLVFDVTADGTADLPLPTPAATVGSFEVLFSTISQVEYPIGDVPETLILDSDWRMYQSPTGTKIRLISIVPTAGDLARVTFTARHLADGSTIPDRDVYPVCYYAASLCFQKLAAIYAQTRDNTVNADVVNYRTKSQEALANAKASKQLYFNALGIDESPAGAEQKPAIALGDMDNILQGGVDRLIHSKYTR